ncbi:MAG: BBP7 family outer membrane beta-barrel protein [Pirellulaceae bacterium]
MIANIASRFRFASRVVVLSCRLQSFAIVIGIGLALTSSLHADPPDTLADQWRPYRKADGRIGVPPLRDGASTQNKDRRESETIADKPDSQGETSSTDPFGDGNRVVASDASEALPEEKKFTLPPDLSLASVRSVLVGRNDAKTPSGSARDDHAVKQTGYTSSATRAKDADKIAPVGYVDHGLHAYHGGCPQCGGNDCGSGGRYCQATWSFRADYLLWTMSGYDVPALVTSSAQGTAITDAGVLGEASTRVLFGQGELADDTRSGGRYTIGRILDPDGLKSIELSYYYIGEASDGFSANSDTTAILARPFFSVDPAASGPNAELVAFPGVLEGNISVSSDSEMQGGGIVAYQVVSRNSCRQIRLLAGYNYHNLDEALLVRDFKRTLDGSLGLAVGTTIEEFDRFRTSNKFNSLVLGTDIGVRHCRWSADLLMKIGLGNTRSSVAIDGRTTTTVPLPVGTDVSTTNTGLLVLDSNRGVFESDEFSVMPQLGFQIGYQLTRCWSAHAGYEFIYWSRVARPGDQIDTNLNLSQLAVGGLQGLAAPQLDWQISDLEIHAFNFGLQFLY